MVTTTYQTVRQVGVREDLTDDISDISPMETPYFSMLRKGKPAKNVYIEWQKDALASAIGTNKAVEGADYTALTATPTTRLRNYCQIWVKGLIVSGTANAVNTAGREEELAYQIAKRGKELKRDMETNLTGNYASAAGASATPRTCAGFEAWLTTSDFGGGTAGATDYAAGGYTAAGTVTAATDGSSSNLVTFTEARLKTVMASCWAAGGQPSILMVGPWNKRAVSAFAGITTKYSDFGNNPSSASGLSIVAAADIYLSDFGKLKVIPNRFSRDRAALFIDPEYVSIHYLRPMQVFNIAKPGDAEKREMLCEATMMVKNEAAHGKYVDLRTS
jgi:hypothetical protein